MTFAASPRHAGAAPQRAFRLSWIALALHGLALTSVLSSAQAQSSLSAGTATRLAPIEVEGQAEQDEQRTPGAVQVIQREALEQANSMADVIRYQPLVTAPGTASGGTRNQSRYDRAGTTGYNIRGIEGNRIGLDVDGVEMPDAVDRSNTSGSGRAAVGTFGMGRDFIDPDTYSAVEIQSGTTSARRSAGGIGGAVSFRTKSPEDYVSPSKPFYAGARVGWYQADSSWLKSLTAAGLADNGLTGLISYTRRDGKQTRNNSGEIDSYPASWHSDALLLKGGMQFTPEQRLMLSADLYRRRNDSFFENWNTTVTAIASDSEQHSKTDRDTFQVSHLWTPANSVIDQLDTRVYYQRTKMDDTTWTWPLGSTTLETDRSQNKTNTWGFSSTGSKVIERHHLRFGVNASSTDVSHPLQVTPLRFGNTSIVPASQPYPDTRTRRLGAFVEDEMTFTVANRRLAVIPGVRVDHIDTKIRNAGDFDNSAISQDDLQRRYGSVPDTTIFSPSLSVVYDLQPRLSAYGQWKHSGRAPNVNEIFGYWNGGGGSYAVVGNPDLSKESSHAFDFGLKGSPIAGVTFNSSVFYTRYRNFIAYTRYTRANNPEMFTNIQDSLSTIFQADNRDSAYIYGAELSTRLDHGAWSPSLAGLYSTWAVGYSKGRSKSYYGGDENVDLDTVMPAKAIVGLGYDAPQQRWGVNLTGTFVRGKQATSTNRNSFTNNPGANLDPSTVELLRVPGYARFDLTGYWRVNRYVRLHGGVYNLGDKRYWDYASARSLQANNAADARNRELLTAPGRTYSVGLAIEY